MDRYTVSFGVVLFWLFMSGWFVQRYFLEEHLFSRTAVQTEKKKIPSLFKSFEDEVTYDVMMKNQFIGTSTRSIYEQTKDKAYLVEYDTRLNWQFAENMPEISISMKSAKTYNRKGDIQKFSIDADTNAGNFSFNGEREGKKLKVRTKKGKDLWEVNLQNRANVGGDLFSGFLFSRLQPGTKRKVQIVRPFSNEVRTYRITSKDHLEELFWKGKAKKVQVINVYDLKNKQTQAKMWVTKEGRMIKQEVSHPMLQEVEMIRSTPLPDDE